MLPVQVYHRACTIGTESTVSVAALRVIMEGVVVVMSMLGLVRMETVAGTAGMVGAVGLADGGHKGWSARHNGEVKVVRVETWYETDKNERREKKEREKGDKTVKKGSS
eukprot:superscaffoldBa00001517_g10918